MTIKSTIFTGRKEENERGLATDELELLRQEVMEECRELIEQSLNELQER